MLAEVHYVQVLRINISDDLSRAVRPRDLQLRSKLACSRTPNEFTLVFEFLHHIGNLFLCKKFLLLRYEDLLGREMLENLVVDFQDVHAQHFAQGRFEVLADEVYGL